MVVRVLLVEDHVAMRAAVAAAIDRVDDLTVVATAGDVDEALAAYRAEPVDVVVTDHSMPGRSGLELLAELRAIDPDVPVVVLSANDEAAFTAAAAAAGASATFTKFAASAELTDYLRALTPRR